MSEKIRFRGLTYHGVPMAFDGPRPDRDGVCLAFIFPEQVDALRKLGVKIHLLAPEEQEAREFYLASTPQGDT